MMNCAPERSSEGAQLLVQRLAAAPGKSPALIVVPTESAAPEGPVRRGGRRRRPPGESPRRGPG